MENSTLLGETGIRISPLGLGTWQWGDRMVWSRGKTHTDADIREAPRVSLGSGITLVDAAEAYGRGRSERLLGEYLTGAGPVIAATQFMPFPWRLRKACLLSGSVGVSNYSADQMSRPSGRHRD